LTKQKTSVIILIEKEREVKHMAQYIIELTVYDFRGSRVTNQFFVNGTECAWDTYRELRDRFPGSASIELIYCETGEIVAYEDHEADESF